MNKVPGPHVPAHAALLFSILILNGQVAITPVLISIIRLLTEPHLQPAHCDIVSHQGLKRFSLIVAYVTLY